jgi:hypothetical protein
MVQELERMTDGDMETMAAREAGHPNLVVGIGWTFLGSFESVAIRHHSRRDNCIYVNSRMSTPVLYVNCVKCLSSDSA